MRKIRNLVVLAVALFMTSSTFIYPDSESFTSGNIEIKKLTKAEFEKLVYDPVKDGEKAVYKGKIPCIVDFYADWCGPCRRLSPILEEIAKEYDGKLIIYKVNVDVEKELARQYDIKSIPTLLLFPKKSKPAMIKGAPSKEELLRYIKEILKIE